jgi:hypothetical protein
MEPLCITGLITSLDTTVLPWSVEYTIVDADRVEKFVADNNAVLP